MLAARPSSLREKRGVTGKLSVNTDISPEVDEDSPLSPPGESRRGRSHILKPIGIASSNVQPATDQRDKFVKSLRAYHSIVPYVHLGLYNFEHIPKLSTSDGHGFTHIIQLQYHPESTSINSNVPDCRLTSDPIANLHVLKLNIKLGEAGYSPQADPSQPFSIHAQHMLLARDFLSLALPYCSDGPSSVGWVKPTMDDRVKVLITAPMLDLEGGGDWVSADVMSIVVCYLAFVSNSDYNYVLNSIYEAKEDLPEAWRTGLDMLAAEVRAEGFIESIVAM